MPANRSAKAGPGLRKENRAERRVVRVDRVPSLPVESLGSFSGGSVTSDAHAAPVSSPFSSLSSLLFIGCSASEAPVRTGNPAFNWRSRAQEESPGHFQPCTTGGAEFKETEEGRGWERRRCKTAAAACAL